MKISSSPKEIKFGLYLLIFLCGCKVHKPIDLEEYRGLAPNEFVQEKEGLPFVNDWWNEFKQPELSETVEEALDNNLDIKESEYLLIKAIAEASIANSWKVPEINLLESAYTGASFNRMRGRGSGFLVLPELSYEIDLWKKIDSRYRSKFTSSLEASAVLDGVNLLISAGAVDLWFTILEQNSLKKVIQNQIRMSKTLLEIMQRRFQVGGASALAVIQQALHYETTRSSLIPVKESMLINAYKLNILCGKPPENPLTAYPDITTIALPPFPSLGSPIDLFLTRPDMRAAANEVMALDFDVAAAIADLYPKLASPFNCRFRLENFTKALHVSLFEAALDLTTPLFDNGRRRSEVTRRRAILYAAIEKLSRRFLQALGEVETSIVKENSLLELIDDIHRQLEIARVSLTLAKEQYVRGLDDYLTVIVAEQSLQTLERKSITEYKNLLANRAMLYRALGGSGCKP